MKTCQSTGFYQQEYIRLLFCFISSVVFAGSAFAFTAPNSINQCYDCHGSPIIPGGTDIRPVDSTYRNITTGGFVGNHRTHITVATSNSLTCTPCHGPAPAAMDHRNGVITMRQHINSSATLRGTYSKPVFFNQTSAPILGTCSNVNCHFQKASTPGWGSNAYTYTDPTTNACAQCHGNGITLSAPQDGSHPNTINKHGLYYGSDASSCAKCHANYTTFSHATSAGHRALILQGTDFPATATYSKVTNLSYPAYLTTTPANRNGTCTTFYCHSQGTGGTKQADGRAVLAPAITPTWGGVVDCTSCHTGGTTTGPTYATTVKANLHPSHTKAGVAYTCDVCHFNVTNNGTTIANYSKHVNGFYNVSANTAKTGAFTYTYAAAGGTCKTSTCHGGAGINLAWSASRGTTQCTKCHGTQSAAIGTIWSSASVAPGSATGGDLAGNLNVSARGGVHQGHLTAATGISAPIHCGECHIVVTAVNTATHMQYTTARPVFTPGNLATAQSHTPSVTRTAGIISCNTTYCHTGKLNTGAAMTPAWNNANYLSSTMTMTDCKQCHNMPPNPGVGIHSGIPAALTAFPVGTTCSCHSNLTTGGTAYATIFTDKTKHINGNIEGGHAFPYPGATHDGATGATTPAASCSGTSCHNVVAAGPYPVAAGTAPNCMGCHTAGILRTIATVSCYDCHGSGPAATTAWPNGTVFPNNNRSHTAHTTFPGITCPDCHTGGGTGTATHGASNRIAKTQTNVVVALAGLAGTAATWTLGTETCSTSNCHGQKSPVWGTAPVTQCTNCHGQANAAYLTNYSSAVIAPGGAGRDTGGKTLATDARVGAHQAHLTAASGISDKMHCGECHITHTAVIDATHLNYTTATVTFQNADLAKRDAHSPTAAKVSGIINCNNTYCHTANRPTGAAAGQSGVNTPPVWNNATLIGGTTVVDTCVAKCHNLPPGAGVVGDTHQTYAAVTTFAGLATCSSNAPATGCHPTIQGTAASITSIATIWASAAAKLLHINGVDDGGTCVGCHSKPIVRTKGRPGTTLAAVSTEFGLAWGHKRTGRGAVTDADCIVCHLEGSFATGKPNPAFHQDGNIDLRDPDGAGETPITNISNTAWTFQRFSTSYAAGSRTNTGHTSNTDIANVVTQKFCLKCHDANGATNPTARSNNGGTGTQYMPFGGINLGATYTVANGAAVAGGLIDTAKQFISTNSSYHPLTAPLNRDFPAATRLAAPYNNNGSRAGTSGTKTLSVVLNCFDCHNTPAPLTRRTIIAHGNAASLRGTIYASGAASTLCTTCHTGYTVSGTHSTGSAWSATGSSHNVSRDCQACHGSQTTTSRSVRPLGAQDYHGNNALVNGGLWPTVNSRPYAFIRGWSGTGYHRPLRSSEFTTGSATCGAGTCPIGGQIGDGSTRTYTAGGSY